MPPVIHLADSPESLADQFTNHFIEWVKDSSVESFHLALSGGKTPSLLYKLLAGRYHNEVPWHKIQFWWGDERMVSPDDPESNYGVANNLLFSKIELIPSQIHRIQGEMDPNQEVNRYGREIESFIPSLDGWPNFDLIMLGLGDDGHTASIFPYQAELLESDQVTALASHPDTGQLRITLTGKVINNAKRVAFLATGTSKAKIYDEIINNSPEASRYPASHIQPDGELHWFVDTACLGK